LSRVAADLIASVREVVAEHVPGARVVLLAGSAAAGTAGATSDLDVVVLVDGAGPGWRRTLTHGGRLVELFVHTENSVSEWWERDAARGRCTLAHMCATGVPVLDDGSAADLRRRAERFIADGPSPSDEDLELRRYQLTASLDDLADATIDLERDVVAVTVVVQAGELALLAERRWLGEGKWLARQLAGARPDLAEQLQRGHRAAVQGDPAVLLDAGRRVLDLAGGPLADGHVRGLPRPGTAGLAVGGADAELDAALSAELTVFNEAAAGVRDQRELTVRVRDDDGALVGGLSGWTWGTCAGVGMFWIREDARRGGWGSRMLAVAEQEAVARGCEQMVLSSFTFQAPDFYRRRGYTETGRTEGLPVAGMADVHFRKDLRS
jgi:GNAT superfamily N-acetyltransferase